MRFSFATHPASVALVWLVSLTPAALAQQTALNIFTFNGTTQGTYPSTPLIEASDGNFYGATHDGGSGFGNIYSISPGGSYTSLYQFSGTTDDGAYPTFLMIGSDGNFYGTTSESNLDDGRVFQLTPSGKLSVIYKFTGEADGANPNFLIEGSDGNLYGTAFGDPQGYTEGSVFEISKTGVFTVLGSFSFPAAGYPLGILEAANGKFYGALTGTITGPYASGVFEYVPGGGVTTIANFDSGSEESPDGQFSEGADGNLYGTMTGGFESNGGVIFRMTPTDAVTSLYNLTGSGYAAPGSGLFLGSDAKFYGNVRSIDENSGAVFSIDMAGNPDLVGLVGFGLTPVQSRLLQGSDGNFYGIGWTTTSSGTGGIYRVSPAKVAPPIAISVSPAQINKGDSATLTWSVVNATSATFQRCFASGAWTGIQASSGSLTVKPSRDGTYNYALTCGGTESSIARLLVGNAAAASSTAITSTGITIAPGGKTVVQVTVDSGSENGATPTGPVTLFNNGATFLTQSLVNGSAPFTVNGSGSEVPVGQAVFKAEYGGDSNYAGSTSKTLPVIFQALPTLTVTAPAYVTQGQTINYTVTVVGPKGSPDPTGTVYVPSDLPYEGTTINLVNGVGKATISTAGNTQSLIQIDGTYNGDNYYVVAYGSATVNLVPPSTVTLTSSATQVAPGQSVALTAQVTGSSGANPNGTVSFEVEGVVLGTSTVNSSGTATLTASSQGISAGTYPVIAIYNGDPNNGIGKSTPLAIKVQ
jgi:uncharacterized repeat protein (TIGR03803 family)